MSDRPCFCGLCVPNWEDLDENPELVPMPKPVPYVVPQVILPKPVRRNGKTKPTGKSRFVYPE